MNSQSPKPEGYFLLMQPDQQQSVRVDFGAIGQIIKRSWIVILASIIVLVGLAGLHVFVLATKIYSSTALVAIRSPESAAGNASQLQGLASIAGIQLGNAGGSKRDEFLAILSSRTLARKLIEREHLLPVLFASQYDPVSKTWKTDRPPTIGKGVDRFVKTVRAITEDKKTGLVTVTIQWRDARLAARWANQLVGIANETVRATTIQDARNNIAYLEREMKQVTFETLRASILSLTQVNMNRAMLAQVQNDYAYAIIDAPEVAERDKFIKPQPVMELAAAFLLGAMLSIGFLLFRNRTQIISRQSGMTP